MIPEVASQIDISKALSIGGWMSERELIWLATMVKGCNNIVEFGSFHGRSTRALADNSPESARIWAVDPWNGDMISEDGKILEAVNTYVMPNFLKNLEDHINNAKVIPKRGFSCNFKSMVPMDMVFLDGDHRYEVVKNDICRGLDLLRTGGILCGHDYGHPTWPGVKKAVDEMLTTTKIEDTIWWTPKF